MKRVLAFILTAALVMTSFVQVFAEGSTDASLEKAISNVKAIIDIPEDFTKFDYSVGVNKGEQVWRLTWKTGDDSKIEGFMSVSIDDTGFITNYNKYSPKGENYTTSRLPKYSRQSAKDAAKAFLEKIKPGLGAKVEEEDGNTRYMGNKDYYFNFHYIENGIPYINYNCSVTINGDTCEVRDYYGYGSKISGIDFPDKNGILSVDDIQKILVKAGSIKLNYLQSFDGEKMNIYPAYSLTKAGKKSYNALDGSVVDSSNGIYYGNGAMYDKVSSTVGSAGIGGGAPNNLTTQELDAVKNVADAMTKDEAEKKIRAIPEIGLDDNYTGSYFNLHKNSKNKDQYIWSIGFRMDPAKAETNKAIVSNYIDVSIDAETGSLISYHTGYYDDRTSENKIDYAAAKAIAEKLAMKFEPDKFSQTELNTDRSSVDPLTDKPTTPAKTTNYSFVFGRVVNGIPCNSDYISVGINGKTGNVSNYTVDWYNGQFPEVDKEKVISMDQAYKNLFEKVGLKLYYVDANNNAYVDTNIQTKPDVKLVYSFNNNEPSTIDALTGEVLNSQGKPYVKKVTKPYNDINGHFSEQAVKILQENGVGFDSEEFLPDQKITQAEFLELIMKSTDHYFTMYTRDDKKQDYIYESLIKRGIIKQEEVNPDAVLSREDSVKFIIRSMGLQRAAEIQGIYVCDFADKDSISQDALGYVCIAKGLNLISGYDGKFLPKESMTRGEAAVLLYNSMK